MATKTGLTAAELRHAHLYGVVTKAAGEASAFADDDLERHIRAAEDFYERDLQIYLGLRRIVSDAASRSLVKGQDYDVEESPYDYPPDFFYRDRWGHLELRHRPVKSIERVIFAFPTPQFSNWEVPKDWIRPELKYGQFSIVPSSGPAAIVSMNSFIFQAFAGGYQLPKSIIVDYTAGYAPEDLRGGYADLLQGIKLMATLFLLPMFGVALSGGLGSLSLSLDGLFRSRGFLQGKYGPYSGMIEAAIEQEKQIRKTFKGAEKGIPMVVL